MVAAAAALRCMGAEDLARRALLGRSEAAAQEARVGPAVERAPAAVVGGRIAEDDALAAGRLAGLALGRHVDRVVARAAIHLVDTRAGVDRVVAVAAGELVLAGLPAGEDVVARPARDEVVARAAVDSVVAVAAVEVVDAVAAAHDVVAVAAADVTVGAAIRVDVVVARAAVHETFVAEARLDDE